MQVSLTNRRPSPELLCFINSCAPGRLLRKRLVFLPTNQDVKNFFAFTPISFVMVTSFFLFLFFSSVPSLQSSLMT